MKKLYGLSFDRHPQTTNLGKESLRYLLFTQSE